MQAIKWLKVQLLGIVLTFLHCSFAHSQDLFSPLITAEGIVKEHLLDESGKILTTNEFPFTISVDASGRWKMALQTYFSQWNLTSTEHISYNGTDVFSVLYSDRRLDQNYKPVNNLPLEDHEHPARICHGPFPVDYSSYVGLLWIAFVGGEFVDQNTIQPPDLLASNARTDPEAWSTDFQFKLLAESPNPLIASGSFLLDKAKIAPDLTGYPEIDEPDDAGQMATTLQMIKLLKAAKNDGLLQSTYSLQESKLVGDVRIPTQFSATRYSDPRSVQHFRRVEWYGEVTNVIAHAITTQLLPPIIGRINVEDRRFKQRTKTQFLNDVWYKLDQTGWVLSTNDSRFLEKNLVRLNTRWTIKSQKKTFFYSSLILLALFISSSAFFLVRKMRSK